MRRSIYTLAILLALASAGCGKSSSSSGGGAGAGTGTNTGVPPVTNPDPTISATSGGATIDLVANKVDLDQYVGWTTNNPTAIKINVSLKKYGTVAKVGGGNDYKYGGYVTVSFTDNSHNYADSFSSLWLGGYGSPYYVNTVPDNATNHAYNLLSSDYPGLNGAVGFHGFFEDTQEQRLVVPYAAPIFGGGLVFVIDNTNDSGDGQGPTSANGSVWFKNYIAQPGMGPIPYTSCWFRTAGPYDCRAWKTSNSVNTKAALYPDNGYVKLGNFYNLDIKKAFNNEI